MYRPIVSILASLFWLLSAACGGELSSASQVGDLRVLAIQATPPEVNVGLESEFLSAEVNALVVGGEGQLTYRWSLCIVGGPVTDGRVCLQPEMELPLGSASTATLVIPSAEQLSQAVPREFEGFELDLSRGLPLRIQLEVSDEGATKVSAFKRIMLSQSPLPNANPVLEGLTLNGQPWDAEEVIEISQEVSKVTLMPRWSEPSREPYDDEGEEVRETLLFSWFIDDALSELDKERSSDSFPENTFRPGELDLESGELSRELNVWLVCRDDRGGASWLSRRIRIVEGE